MNTMDSFSGVELHILAGIFGFALGLMFVKFIPAFIFIVMLPFLPKKGPLKK